MRNVEVEGIDAREEAYALEMLNNRSDSICYVECDGYDIFLVNEFGYRYRVNKTMDEVINTLNRSTFVKVSETIIVNSDRIQELWVSNEPLLVMSCGNIVPIPVSFVYTFKKKLEGRIGTNWGKSTAVFKNQVNLD